MACCKSMGKGRGAMSPSVQRCVCGRLFCQFVLASYCTFPSFLSLRSLCRWKQSGEISIP